MSRSLTECTDETEPISVHVERTNSLRPIEGTEHFCYWGTCCSWERCFNKEVKNHYIVTSKTPSK